MTSDRHLPVAIVGGGFSGTMVAAHLARKGIESVLIDGAGRAGHGVAYSTREPAHVLNVRAEVMSAWAHDLDHFVRVAEADGGHRRDFVQRQQFGRYLRGILKDTIDSGCLRLVERQAVEAEPGEDGWTLQLDNGEELRASGLVLAIGNQPPEPLPFGRDSSRVIHNPWSGDAQAAVEDLAASNEDVLLVGTGLTMVDAVLSLDAAGHRGRIVALSRRGLIPRGHTDSARHRSPPRTYRTVMSERSGAGSASAARKSAGARPSTGSGRTATASGRAFRCTSRRDLPVTPGPGGTFIVIASPRKSLSDCKG
ncbi:FAD/NAD(P)-binding protein [Sphingomonas sediminicola]|uniref:FAD/NAD(P)-binding protein n=1 Tax=Sphingomonas sediminicola TaxID=386874 RepID=A0ABX6TAT0_9SPHN|nr:FAD/NAD(P)-binding protein [Sphingomonas sediminicola]QNP46348.1 FAD/NAD(P)-binding protein [Sphingomonas sediminicola]